jgi:two-component system, sensor histidine kinase YesM
MKKRTRTLFRRPNYYQKFVLSHLLVLFVTVIIMAGFSYIFSRDVQNQRMLDVVGYSGKQTASSIEARFSQMINVSETVRYSLQQMLGESLSKPPQPQVDASTINNLKMLRDAFNFCDINAWLPTSYFSAREGITFFDISMPGGRPQLPDVLNAPYNKLTWMSIQNYTYPFMRFSSYSTYNILSCFRRVSTLYTPGAFCFFIDIYEREISDLLSQKVSSVPIEQYIVDSNGTIISHSDKSLLGTQVADNLKQEIYKRLDHEPLIQDHQVYLRYLLNTTGWSLIVTFPESYLFSLSLTSIKGILLAICVAILVSLLISVLISRQLMRKFVIMSNVIRSIEPSFKINNESFEKINVRMPVPPEGTPPDELDELALVFNTLLVRLNNTMQNALINSLTQEKLRYQLLRAKINPHFLYNILDSIKICNSLGRDEDANLMLSKLSSFYRLILRKNDLDIIAIGEELEIVKLYLEMEAISHEQSFTYTLEIDPDIENFSIPRFVLQPLVENCVIHGLPGDTKRMTISISLHYTEDAIIITIEDDGLGMSPDQMERLMKVIHDEGTTSNLLDVSTAFYGLTNVCARLKPYVVNPGIPIYYVSTPGMGTRVSIELRQLLQND